MGMRSSVTPGERAGVSANSSTTSIRYGVVTGVNGSTATIELDDTGESITTQTDTPLAVGNRVAIIKNGQSVIVYATEEIVNQIGAKIDNVDVEYAVGTSQTTAPQSGWQTDPPTVGDGEYLWQRVATYSKGEVSYSTPVCLTSDISGKQIEDVEEQFYLSTSSTTQSGGYWQSECPEWKADHYIWTRTVITYDDGSSTVSAPVLAVALNQANEEVAQVKWHFFADDDGVHVTETESNATTGANALLTGGRLAFRDGEIELASFQPELVELGKNSTGARIQMCGGAGMIDSGASYDTNGTIGSNGVAIHSSGGVILVNNSYDQVGSSDSWVALQDDGKFMIYAPVHIRTVAGGVKSGQLYDFVTAEGVSNGVYYRVWASGKKELWGNKQMTFRGSTGARSTVTFPSACRFSNYENYNVLLQLMGTSNNSANYFNNIQVTSTNMSTSGFDIYGWNTSTSAVYYRVAFHVIGCD